MILGILGFLNRLFSLFLLLLLSLFLLPHDSLGNLLHLTHWDSGDGSSLFNREIGLLELQVLPAHGGDLIDDLEAPGSDDRNRFLQSVGLHQGRLSHLSDRHGELRVWLDEGSCVHFLDELLDFQVIHVSLNLDTALNDTLTAILVNIGRDIHWVLVKVLASLGDFLGETTA